MLALRTLVCSALLTSLATSSTLPASGQRFKLETVNVQSGQTWPLNRAILFGFNEALDFSTVNLNTVRIVNVVNGLTAVGEFSLQSPSELVFQPSCPSSPDLSDTGLEMGATYNLFVPDATNSSIMLLAESGKRLYQGAQVTFQTPASSNPADLFDDEEPGPPAILLQPATADSSRVTTGAGDEAFFQLGGNGLATLPPGFLVPNNLYSDLDSRVTVHVRFNQTLLPVASNFGPDRVRIEYEDSPGSWFPLPTSATLLQSCGGGGSTLLLTAQGIFPQARTMRVWIGSGFKDITGDATLVDLDHLRFDTDAYTEDGVPARHADQWFEEFADDTLEDTEATFPGVPAEWGAGGLQSTDGFDGTGGPGGDFDYHVPPGVIVIIDTTSAVIVGGPNGQPTTVQNVIGGVVDVRDLYVPASSKLLFSGPNPATILATGTVTIDGTISVDGFNANPVFTLNQANQPELGAAGNCGGGSGGVGSYVTTQVTPRGGPGHGAFGIPGLGGQGGESGYSSDTSGNGVNRRAAGGGGGRFGHDQLVRVGMELCQDQSFYGLDAESGFSGSQLATSSQGNHMPFGGLAAPSPFDAIPGEENDFWGRAILDFQSPNPVLIHGELPGPWAGAGGGAGGDATRIDPGQSYPPPTFILSHQDKGAGGGGGAGSISMYVKENVVFGTNGRLTAIGGHGSAGENTAGINRIGGGSGGGAGGHIVIHTGGDVDLSQVVLDHVAIDARGGQGGEGANGLGGASNQETSIVDEDAKHIGANNGVDNPWEFLSGPCLNALTGELVVEGAGGDGGPGLVQLHVSNLAGPDASHDILYPASGLQEELLSTVRPTPFGFDRLRKKWRHQLLPDIGNFSQGQSKWIALGHPQASPGTQVPDTLELLFGGTDPATGLIEETNGTADVLPPILAPANAIELPGLPNIAGDLLIYFDAAGLTGANEIYRRNPNLLRGFDLGLGGTLRRIESASLAPHGSIEVLKVTVEPGPALPLSGQATVHPRFFRVFTPGAVDVPSGTSVRVEWQAAGTDARGNPDPWTIYPSTNTWATDPATLTNHPNNADFRFLRFRISFDLGNTPSTPDFRPIVDWMKPTFGF